MRVVKGIYCVVITVVALTITAGSQSPIPLATTDVRQEYIDPNNWRWIQCSVTALPDNVPPHIRALRDAFWSRDGPEGQHSSRRGIAHNGSLGIGHLYGPTFGTPGYVDPTKNTTWILGTFVSHDVHETSNGSMYTEIHVRVDGVAGPITQTSPRSGSVVDVVIEGGCLKSADGAVHVLHIWDYQYAIKPNRKYIFPIIYVEKGDFYEPKDPLIDLTGGSARPLTNDGGVQLREGRWPYSGLSEAGLVKRFGEEVNMCKSKGGKACENIGE